MVEVWEQHWGQRPCFVLFLLCSGPFWPLGDILRKVGHNNDSLTHQLHRPLGNFHSVFKCASQHLKHGGGIYNNQTQAMCQLGCWQAYRMSQSSAFYCCAPGLPSALISSRAGYGGNVADLYFPTWQLLHVLCLSEKLSGVNPLHRWRSKKNKKCNFCTYFHQIFTKTLKWSEAAMNPSLKLVLLCDVSYFYSCILHHNRHILKTRESLCLIWMNLHQFS